MSARLCLQGACPAVPLPKSSHRQRQPRKLAAGSPRSPACRGGSHAGSPAGLAAWARSCSPDLFNHAAQSHSSPCPADLNLTPPCPHSGRRYEDGDDKELAEKATVKLTAEEQAARAEAIASGKRVVDYLNSRWAQATLLLQVAVFLALFLPSCAGQRSLPLASASPTTSTPGALYLLVLVLL